MASNIKFKRSAVQNRVPTTAQLDLGELALNTYDGKLYTEINTGSAAVIEIGSKPVSYTHLTLPTTSPV